MDLFSFNQQSLAPLADRMRPRALDEFIGQEHIVGEGKLLRRAIAAGTLGSCIFYGPPGSGKTTLAYIIADTSGAHFEKLNAVSAGVADCKRIIVQSADRLRMYGKKTYLLLDECHRFNKAQSDCLLQAIEKGQIIFIGSTTENPYASLTPALVSRCRVFEFKKLSDGHIRKALERALSDEERARNLKIRITADAIAHIIRFSSGT